jgi:hypothetical protein
MPRDDQRRERERRAERDKGRRLKRVDRQDSARPRERAREPARDRPVEREKVTEDRRERQSSMTWVWVLLGLIVAGVLVWFLFFRDSSSAATAGTSFGFVALLAQSGVRQSHVTRRKRV